MTSFVWSPSPPVAGRWVEVQYTGPGDLLFWRVAADSHSHSHSCAFAPVLLDGYKRARWRVPLTARQLYLMDWDSHRAAPPVAGEGQVSTPVHPDPRL